MQNEKDAAVSNTVRFKRSLVNTGLALALIALIVIGVLTYLHMVNATEAVSLVKNAAAMRWELSNLLSALKDAETGQKGFIITGNRAYLDTYNKALVDINQTLSRLRPFAHDSPEHWRNLNEIETLIKQRLEFIKETISVRSAQGFEPAQRMMQKDRGRQLMNELQARVASAQQQKTLLLEQRIVRTKSITAGLTENQGTGRCGKVGIAGPTITLSPGY